MKLKFFFETMKINIRNLSPVVIFAFNRLEHLKKTIKSLKKCKYSDNTNLIIYLDNYNIESDKQKVISIKNFIHKIKCFKKIKLIQRKKNLGMSKNIILGVSQTLKKFKKEYF